MDRRRFVTVTGSTLAVLAGCTSGETDGSGADGGGGGETDTETATGTPTDTPTSTSTESSTPTPEATYQVRVEYDGEWSGSVGAADSMRSVDGQGTRTIDLEGDPVIVSANAQKQDDGSGTLTIQILKGGEVIAEESTSAEYGVAQVTSEDDTQSGDGGGSSGDATFEVRIQYDGEWSGSVGSGGSMRSVDGQGNETIPIEGSPDVISANAQKQDDSSKTLTVQILEDGEVVKETSTDAEYGVAQVTHSTI